MTSFGTFNNSKKFNRNVSVKCKIINVKCKSVDSTCKSVDSTCINYYNFIYFLTILKSIDYDKCI